MMSKDEFSVIVEKLAILQKSLDIFSRDREYDAGRTDKLTEEMQETRIRLGAMEAQIDELRKQFDEFRKIIKTIPAKTSESVGNAMESTNRTMENLQEIIVDKEVVAINTQKSKHQPKRWWQIW